MYLHKKEYEIRYTDVDFADNLKLSSLISMLEESACLSADELGFGYSVLAPKNIGFILANWYIALNRAIRLGEKVMVHTWPIKPKKLIVFRDFEIFVGDEKVGVATSRWCMVNLSDFSMLPASVIFANDEREYNDFRSVEFSDWKIPRIDCAQPSYEKVVSYSDYDHYEHVNNTKYADLLIDAFSPEQLKGKFISSAQITYDKQCKYGEKLQFFKQQIDDYFLVEGRVDGELRVQLRVKFNEI
jgi:acyl-ACP thioesterase